MLLTINLSKVVHRVKGSKLISNFFYLFSLQVFNYILPLVTFPYLIRVLQPESYGLTAYAQTIMLYFIVLVDYGFNITATRKISIHKDDKNAISNIFSTVITTKVYLLLVCFLILIPLIVFIPKFSGLWLLYLLSSGIIVGQVLFPVWLFQGLQEMKYLMYFNFISRVTFTILIFLVVKGPEDFIYVNLLGSVGLILVGVISVFFVISKYKLKFYFADFSKVMTEIREGWIIFLSNFAIQMYLISNLVILGFFANDTVVGHYSIAEKLISVLRLLLVILSQVIYPHICELITRPDEIKAFFRRKIYPLLGGVFFLSLSLFLFAEPLVALMVDTKNVSNEIDEIVNLVKMLSFVPFIVGLGVPAYQTLLAYNKKRAYSLILISCSLLNLLLNLLLASRYGAYGTAVSVVLTEALITVCLIIAFTNKSVLPPLEVHPEK